VWVLKCDIRKFFASIDHSILLLILRHRINDESVVWLFGEIIGSFHTNDRPGVGLPLGNLTSQLLVNIYMNEFDHFQKRELKATHYIRYADDFVILHSDREYLIDILPKISVYLEARLKLSLHPNKVSIRALSAGVDFLGWVHFPYHRVLRTATKRRMFARVAKDARLVVLASYRGMLSHGNAHGLSELLGEVGDSVKTV
jgi:hypothetical protein